MVGDLSKDIRKLVLEPGTPPGRPPRDDPVGPHENGPRRAHPEHVLERLPLVRLHHVLPDADEPARNADQRPGPVRHAPPYPVPREENPPTPPEQRQARDRLPRPAPHHRHVGRPRPGLAAPLVRPHRVRQPLPLPLDPEDHAGGAVDLAQLHGDVVEDLHHPPRRRAFTAAAAHVRLEVVPHKELVVPHERHGPAFLVVRRQHRGGVRRRARPHGRHLPREVVRVAEPRVGAVAPAVRRQRVRGVPREEDPPAREPLGDPRAHVPLPDGDDLDVLVADHINTNPEGLADEGPLGVHRVRLVVVVVVIVLVIVRVPHERPPPVEVAHEKGLEPVVAALDGELHEAPVQVVLDGRAAEHDAAQAAKVADPRRPDAQLLADGAARAVAGHHVRPLERRLLAALLVDGRDADPVGGLGPGGHLPPEPEVCAELDGAPAEDGFEAVLGDDGADVRRVDFGAVARGTARRGRRIASVRATVRASFGPAVGLRVVVAAAVPVQLVLPLARQALDLDAAGPTDRLGGAERAGGDADGLEELEGPRGVADGARVRRARHVALDEDDGDAVGRQEEGAGEAHEAAADDDDGRLVRC
ncbi:hypothetical protein CTA1_11787 [Colletotrichum tanaceti]|uniref:Uncharacterized protein n=1 Tax=Colletotrichum tanaceti TaxID=1306861 RepID=A0A4U6XFA2_9PEZI|nr:hypothetical protein CTA1_11787 [Colletotrichum tanaceti]